MSSKEAATVAALVGSVMMPHNLYLHSGLVLSRQAHTKPLPERRRAMSYLGIDSAAALLVSFLINVAVVSVFASGFHDREGSGDIGLMSAGAMLVVTFGPAIR